MRKVVVSVLMVVAGILLVLGIIGAILPKEEITLKKIIDTLEKSLMISSLREDGHQITIDSEGKQFVLTFDETKYIISFQNQIISLELQNNAFDKILVAVLYDSIGQLHGYEEFDSYTILTVDNPYHYTLANDGLELSTTSFKIDTLKEPKKGKKVEKESLLNEVKDQLSLEMGKDPLEIKINRFIDETLDYLNKNASSSVNYPVQLTLEELPVTYKPSNCESIKGIPTFNFTNCVFEGEIYSYEEGQLKKIENNSVTKTLAQVTITNYVQGILSIGNQFLLENTRYPQNYTELEQYRISKNLSYGIGELPTNCQVTYQNGIVELKNCLLSSYSNVKHCYYENGKAYCE